MYSHGLFMVDCHEPPRSRIQWLVICISYNYVLQTAHCGLTQEWFRELSFSKLECGVHDRLHIYDMYGIFSFPWHIHQIEGTNGMYCLFRKTHRYTISNVESKLFTHKI